MSWKNLGLMASAPHPTIATTSAIEARWPAAIGEQRRQDFLAAALLQAQRDGEQPAHRRVQAVVSAHRTTASHGQVHRSWVAVGVRGGVAALQAHLMRPLALKSHKEVRIDLHPAVGIGVDLRHPSAQPLGIELLVPRRVQRVGQIDPAAVAAQLHHLRRRR